MELGVNFVIKKLYARGENTAMFWAEGSVNPLATLGAPASARNKTALSLSSNL
jgi:hypothetical protein